MRYGFSNGDSSLTRHLTGPLSHGTVLYITAHRHLPSLDARVLCRSVQPQGMVSAIPCIIFVI